MALGTGIVYKSGIMQDACMRFGSWRPHSSLVDNPGPLPADLEGGMLFGSR